jgi:5-amino-6-(5-phosphoribosylamino)uracil reductase
MQTVLADLRQAQGARLLLCEGGPTLFGQLVAEAVADELFLTLAAKLVGRDRRAITEGLLLDEPAELTLRWVLEQDGSLYLRYGLHP